MNRLRTFCALFTALMSTALIARADPTTKPATTQPAPGSLFHDPQDGAFDVSGFLSTREGFLPVVVPITEPAVGYGLSLGLSFFHGKPQLVPGHDGDPARIIMPSTTVLLGAGTENGTWATGLAHLGVWQQGKIRYLGALGYASANLNWFGKDNSLQGQSISYTNNVFFLFQRITFQLGDSNFYLGPQYKFLDTDAQFDFSSINSGIPSAELESKTSGLGLDFSYDSLDQPFSPTRGVRAEVSYSQQAEALGGDFNYGKLQTYGILYIPLAPQFVLGLKVNGDFNIGTAPFYDLSGLDMRGLEKGEYVDNDAVQFEGELRYDVTPRWSLVGFGGIGRVGGSVSNLLDAENRVAYGTGFRYLIARAYGMRMGVDLAYNNRDFTVYVTVGTGWVRP
jgi:Omp85 superfamily domain